MPFALTILDEKTNRYIQNSKNLISEFMIF